MITNLTRATASKQVDVLQLRCARDMNNVLHIAATLGHVELVNDILSHWSELMSKANSRGDLPIHSALKTGKLESAKALSSWIKQSRNTSNLLLLERKNSEGNNALHIAMEYEELGMARELVDLYPRALYVMNNEGICPLYMAIKKEIVDLVERMVEKLQSCNYSPSDGRPVVQGSRFVLNARGQNITRIHLATLTADSQLLSHLLSSLPKGHSLINQKDEDGNTPLHLATKAKHVEVVETLINNEQVDVKLSNKEGLSANDLAMKLTYVEEDEDVVQRLKFMLERAYSNHKCCEIDDEMYRLLVNREVEQVIDRASHRSCELTDLVSLEDGNNVLHIAACIGDTQLIQDLLVRHNCITLMYQANKTGDLPIHSAVKASKLQSLRGLFQWSETIPSDHICKRQNVDGNTALHVAVLYNHRDSANYLYENCPQAAYCLNKDNICPLFLAIKIWSTCENKLIQQMISGLQGNAQVQNHLKDAESVIHVAILVRSRVILEIIIDKAQGLLDSIDNYWKSFHI